MGLSSLLTKKETEGVSAPSVIEEPLFDTKYKVVLKFQSSDEDFQKISWINSHSRGTLVSVKFANDTTYMAFENESTALIFKIRYL